MRKLAFILTALTLLTLVIGAVGCDRLDELRERRSTATPPTQTSSPTATPAAPALTPTPTLASTPTPTPAPTVPPLTSLPCRFHGTVELNSAPVANGTVITATIAGDTYQVTTPSIYGAATYRLQIVPPAGKTYASGTVITFKIGDRVAEQTGTWEIGGNTELNLSAG